jgi:pilus assembly protein CpaE
MPEVSVVIVASDSEQRAVLQVLVDGTSVARAVYSAANFPTVATDPAMRRIQSANPDVVLVDIPADGAASALRTIELLQQEVPQIAVFAIGSLSQPQVIVNAMRSGAREFIERPTTTTELLEAFVRLSTAQRKVQREGTQGKIFAILNSKGGSGATTVAVNLAMALQSAYGNTALADVATVGHAALHMNLKPMFTVADAIRNLHRLDQSLLEGFMTRHESGLQVLAGSNIPILVEPSPAEFARLFDMLTGHYRYVVVDVSTRADATEIGRAHV